MYWVSCNTWTSGAIDSAWKFGTKQAEKSKQFT